MRTNYKNMIDKLIANQGGKRASVSGIGLDFKTVDYYNKNGRCKSVGGANYKDCYNELCRKIANYGEI